MVLLRNDTFGCLKLLLLLLSSRPLLRMRSSFWVKLSIISLLIVADVPVSSKYWKHLSVRMQSSNCYRIEDKKY